MVFKAGIRQSLLNQEAKHGNTMCISCNLHAKLYSIDFLFQIYKQRFSLGTEAASRVSRDDHLFRPRLYFRPGLEGVKPTRHTIWTKGKKAKMDLPRPAKSRSQP